MKQSRRLSRDEYTVGWVCALTDEFTAAQEMLDEEHQDLPPLGDDANIYTLGCIGEHNVVLTCLPAGQMGNNPATAVGTQMKATFPAIRFGLMVGIGGGVPSKDADIRLGDVVVSQPGKRHGGVIQYDFGKLTPTGFERTGFLNAPPQILLAAIRKLQSNHDRGRSSLLPHLSKLNKLPKFTREQAGSDVLFQEEYDHAGEGSCASCAATEIIQRKERSNDTPVVHYGTVASGNQVMRDGKMRGQLSSAFGGVLCFEMEAAGLMNSFPCLVIRGICDYADSHKNKAWQPYAAGTAAAYAKELLMVIPAADVARTRTVDVATRGDPLPSVLSRLPIAKDAPFNSLSKQHEPECLENTRTDLLQEIYDWVDGPDKRCIFWLSGLAGTGKSTISRTVARKYFAQDRLAASFFFSRGGGDVGRADKLVSSIAFQLAHTIPTLGRHICNAFTERPDIINHSLRDQWQRLVLGPLSKLDSDNYRFPHVLVIDALDESDGDNDIRLIVKLLAEARTLVRARLRVFLTSRPEMPIRSQFRQMPAGGYYDFVLHSISPPIVDRDISTFFWHELTLIGQELLLDTGWLGEETVRILVQKASGLFIWASTACRFIKDGFSLEESLHAILEGSTSVSTPENQLDEIYTIVLQKSTQNYREQDKSKAHTFLRHILGTVVVLFSPLSVKSLSGLLSIQRAMIIKTISHLHSILYIPTEPSRPLRLHHPSFRDFLLSSERCTDSNFWIDKRQTHTIIAQSCIKLMSDPKRGLRQDMCGMKAPGILVADVKASRIEQCLSPEHQYACLYWVQHLQNSDIAFHDDGQVHQFLKKHLLHWLEVLSWIRRVSDGINAITSLQAVIKNHNCPQLSKFIYDMRRFFLYNRSVIEQAPLQAYSSALVFAPMMSKVRIQFKYCIPHWIQRLPEVAEDWNALLQTLEGHKSSATTIAFSPDGSVLASGSHDRTVRLWDAATGVLRRTLSGSHSGSIAGVTFSPDGILLASASTDRTVQLWDTATGALQQTLKSHSSSVAGVTFSPDGSLLASASWDCTARLWDMATGAPRRTLVAHTRSVVAVAFSSDGAILASASADRTIIIWDTRTGMLQQTLRSHSGSITSVAFSPDSILLASASADRTVKLWNAVTGTLRQTLKHHFGSVVTVAFSPDGVLLASGSHDQTVRLWNSRTGALQQTFRSHSGWVNTVAFSPDGTMLASAFADGTVKLWDPGMSAPPQTRWGRVPVDWAVNLLDAIMSARLHKPRHHGNLVSAVAFSPDRARLVSASWDRTIKVWEADTGALQFTLNTNSSGTRFSFSDDGTLLLTDKGTFFISTPHPAGFLHVNHPSKDISVGEQWITWDKERMLWLPPEHRPSCFATSGNMVALGYQSGRVSIIEFDLSMWPRTYAWPRFPTASSLEDLPVL